MTRPTGLELARPFLPARDFAVSKAFYEVLGFTRELDSEVAIFGVGAGGFILQNYYQKDWAENFMMQMMVNDLDAWWTHIESLDLPGKFGVPALKARQCSRGDCASPIWSIPAASCGMSPKAQRVNPAPTPPSRSA